MLAAAGIVLVVASVAIFMLRLRLGLYSRYPYEQFVLVGAAGVVGAVAAIANPGVLTLGLLALEIAALAFVVRYLAIGQRFPDDELKLKTGERFPEFVLPDSEGRSFHSRTLVGASAALYIFYRGHF
jgi:hypothetical protein